MTYADPLVTWMKAHNIPLTRDRYLNLAYPDGEPDELSAEQESMLPPEIQLGGVIALDVTLPSETVVVDDSTSTVSYLHADFSPADASTFYFAKVNFDNGGSVFLVNPNGAQDAESGAEASAFARHRGRQMVPPVADNEGSAESAAFEKHRMGHRTPMTVYDTLDDPTEVRPEDIPVKLQLVAWAKAIVVLDHSEILVRDLIERELVGAKVMPIARVLVVTDRLLSKIKVIREHAIKTAFRLLRDRLGDPTILDHSLGTWAQAFVRDDTASIKLAIQQGLGDGLDSTEIARKVVGTMGLNGVDGCTEFTRHKIAHLGRAAIKASQAR